MSQSDLDNPQYISQEEQLPDLSHWKPVSEFTVEEAALLMAGIDPAEATIGQVEKQKWPRWRYAATYGKAIVRAIRQGLLQTVFCAGYDEQWNSETVLKEIKPSDRKIDISMSDTVITRATLVAWILRERIEPIACILYRKRMKGQALGNTHPCEPPPKAETPQAPICLPRQEHTSEGLSLVDETIVQFWSTWSPDDPSTIPKKGEVINHLKSLGATQNLAEAADKICRPTITHRARLKNHAPPTRATA